MPRNRSRVTWRVIALAGFFVLATLGLVGRLAYIQIINHDSYLAEANAEHFDKREVRSTRGAILDRNGFPLATSVEVFDLYIDQRVWEQDPSRAQTTANGLAPLLGRRSRRVAGKARRTRPTGRFSCWTPAWTTTSARRSRG